MIELPVPEGEQDAERLLKELPNRPAVFLLWPREGNPYLARTNVLLAAGRAAAPQAGSAVTLVESAGNRGANRIRAHWFTAGRAIRFVGAGAPPLPGELSGNRSNSAALLRKADSFERVPADTGDVETRARAGRLCRPVPESLHGR